VKTTKLDPGFSVFYSVLDLDGNIILNNLTTSTSTPTAVTIDQNGDPIAAGIYTIQGTINCSPSISFSETVFIGYRVEWSQLSDYSYNAISSSLERDAQTNIYASARSSNILKFDDFGLIEFTVESDLTTDGAKHIMRFTTD